MNYYRHYLGDYSRDTANLTASGHGAYRLLLDHQYSTEGPLPETAPERYVIARAFTEAEQAATDAVVALFFAQSEPEGLAPGLWNKRAIEEVGKARSAIERMAEAGRRGAKARWGSGRGANRVPHLQGDGVPHENPNGDPNGVSMDPPSSNHQEKKEDQEAHPDAQSVDNSGADPVPPVGGNGSHQSIWDVARGWLGGNLLGRTLRDYGEEATQAAIVCTLKKNPAEPKPYLLACLKDGNHERPQGHGRPRSVVDRIKAANRRREAERAEPGPEGRTLDGEYELI